MSYIIKNPINYITFDDIFFSYNSLRLLLRFEIYSLELVLAFMTMHLYVWTVRRLLKSE